MTFPLEAPPTSGLANGAKLQTQKTTATAADLTVHNNLLYGVTHKMLNDELRVEDLKNQNFYS